MLLDSEVKGGVEDQQVILEKLAALERAQALSPGDPADVVRGAASRVTHQVTQRQFQAQIHNCLVCLAQSKGVVVEESGRDLPEEV